MHVPDPRNKQQLFLRELRIDQGEGKGVKSQIPGSVPGIFPLVWHRNNVGIVKMGPFVVTTELTLSRWRWLRRVTFQPLSDIVVEILLTPDHPGQCLALHALGVI